MASAKNLTMGKLLLNRVAKNPKLNALGWIKNNDIQYYDYEKYFKIIQSLSLGLIKIGLAPQTNLSILSHSCKEWHLIDMATQCSRAVVVPIYPSYLSAEIKYIIKHSESKVIVVQNKEQLLKIIDIQDQIRVEKIISIENIDKSIISKLNPKTDYYSFNDIVKLGKTELSNNKDKVLQNIDLMRGEDIASIIYTSGTTGEPKGAVITQHAFASMLSNVQTTMKGAFSESDRTLIFLPLSHVLGRADSVLHLIFGLEPIYAESIDKVIDNIGIVKPTVLVAVPRIFEKIYEKVMGQIEAGNFVKKTIFNWALKVSNEYYEKVEKDISPTPSEVLKKNMAFTIVFSKIYNRFGGRIRFFVSGGAPIAKEISKFLRNAKLTILEGYGLTETIAPCVLNPIEKQIPGAVGIPMDNVEIKFDKDGEILIKTEGMLKEYYKNPETTKESFTDGWFRSGDIGKFNDEGYLVITDRKKDIIITSGGKNVAPQMIENKMKTRNYICQFMVVGDKRKYLTAIVGIEKEQFIKHLEEMNLSEKSNVKDIAKHPKAYELIKTEIDKVNKDLASFETIKKFHISEQEFTVENGFLTPSMKIKKKMLMNEFDKKINEMYQ